MVNKSLDSEIFMNKNNKCRFSYLYLLHNDLTKKKIIIIIANKKHSSNDNKNYNNSNNIANNNKMTWIDGRLRVFADLGVTNLQQTYREK